MQLLRFVWLLLFSAHPQVVDSKVDLRVTLHGADGPCEGYVAAYYNKTLGHMGDKHWNWRTEKAVCRSTHCGQPIYNATVDVPLVVDKVWLNELNCTGSEKDLLDCVSPGLGISFYNKPTVKKMQCSNNIKLSLVGSQCSGVVQYSINGKQASGYICSDTWGEKEASLLCQSLNCGDMLEIPLAQWVEVKNFSDSSKMQIDCAGIRNVTHLWQCVKGAAPPLGPCLQPAGVTCKKHKRLQLRGSPSNVCSGKLEKRKGKKWVDENTSNPRFSCQQMHCGSQGNLTQVDQNLTCSDNVSVVLWNPSQDAKCYGEVRVRVNGDVKPVCGNEWKQEEDELVCRELGCGKVAHSGVSITRTVGIMDYVRCSDEESSLWHCRAKRGPSLMCNSVPQVICSESVKVKLVDGPGRCAGRLAVSFAGQWKRVIQQGWTGDHSDAVCKQLNCGDGSKPNATEKYSQGSGSLVRVACQPKMTRVSDCRIHEEQNPAADAKAVEVTCKGHKVVFLKGTQACSGEVGIRHADGTHWLSGSNATWNKESADTVCQQMNCGEASSFQSKPRADKAPGAIWKEAYACSSANKDLFDCETKKTPRDHNDSIALVDCSGRINVSLSNGCWGQVKVCSKGVCGGVCGDAWTKEMSEMLCKNLGCGDRVLDAHGRLGRAKILYKSLHSTDYTEDVSQCNLVKNQENDYSCEQKPAYVVCSGSLKPRFQQNKDSCSGNVVVDYEGQPLPVCMSSLQDTATQNAICRQLNCGQAQSHKVLRYVGPVPRGTSLRISALQCSSTDGTGSWSKCYAQAENSDCECGGLQCSAWKKMSFSEPCQGEVVVHTEGGMRWVSVDGWTNKEGERLCRAMECGKFVSKLGIAPKPHEALSFWNRSFSCGDGVGANIWDCETPTAPTQKQKLSIRCQDPPKVSLSQQCHGQLMISGTAVCSRNWEESYSQMVCQQLNCGNALPDNSERHLPAPLNTYHIHCEKDHYELGQCQRVRGTCDAHKAVTVYCINSIKFKTEHHCGGELQVNYQDKWKSVHVQSEASSETQHRICKEMQCGGHNAKASSEKSPPSTERNMALTLHCTEEMFDAKYCVQEESSTNLPAQIYCDDYVDSLPEEEQSRVLLAIIFGAIFVVILLIGVLTFVGLRMMKKLKKPGIFERKLSSQKGELESGSYTEVAHRENDLDSVHESNAELFSENDMQSTSSLPYDDIDEVAEAQPLTDGSAVSASAGKLLPTDKVTYEVDDPQENYDDVGTAQTEAQVYDKPSARPASVALPPPPPPQPEQEDGDYLVPGEDG